MAKNYSHVGMDYSLPDIEAMKAMYELDDIFIHTLASESKKIVTDALDPLKRTGDLESSWKIITRNDGFDIVSDDWAASSIQLGFSQPAPKDTLLAWMKLKPEFSGLDNKEASRVAFAIRRHMLNGGAPGKTSTIGPLSPSGERKYDYFSVVVKNIQNLLKAKFR